MATRLKPSRINVDNTPRVGDGAAYQNDNDFHWSMGGGDMAYRDFEWHTLTGTSLVIEDISNNITPSSNFTVSAGTVKPGIEYVLRVNTGNTPYTMTLGTGVTNPNGYSTELTPNKVNQFKFIATSDSQLELEGVDTSEYLTGLTILSYGTSTWNDFITAYQKNAIVYCRASSNSNPATGAQNRLAFMAYVNNATSPTEVEFQYYRSRSSHGSDDNQQDEVYVYKLTSTSGGTWTVEIRDTAAKIATGTGLTKAYTTSGTKSTLTIANDGVLTVNGANGTVTVNDIKQSSTAPANPTAGTAWYDTTNGALKVYNGSAWDTIATGGSISDTTYGSAWDGQTTTAPSQNAVYDKISAMDTTISGKQDTLVSGTNIKTVNNNSLLGSGNLTLNDVKVSSTAPASPTEGMVWYDTTNDVVKVYDGTNWNEVGVESNTKTFYLSSTSDLTNAQAAYDWYAAGKNPIVVYNNKAYIIKYVDIEKLQFGPTAFNSNLISNSTNSVTQDIININFSAGVVTSISTSSFGLTGNFLRTDYNYSSPYTPAYDGSPATKKYVDDRDTYIGSSAPASNLVEGRLRYDTTNDQLKVYDGTNWNATGKEYNVGPGIAIGAPHKDTQGPAPDGFHVPLKSEWQALCGTLTNTLGLAGNATTMGVYLKMPMAGDRNYSTGNINHQGTDGRYWTSSRNSADFAYNLYFYSTGMVSNGNNRCNYSYTLRCFKDTPTIPTSSWTTLYDGSSIATGAGVFYNATDGLISVSGDGQTWYTIQDKNLGATTVYNNGDTLSEANCGKYYQWGNNYGFPRTGSVTTSSTQVDASNYGPGNYYSNSTFIATPPAWDSSGNSNLWGGVSQGTWVGGDGNTIANTGVLSVNGQTGNVTVSGGIQLAPNTELNIKYHWYGSQASYDSLNQYYTDTANDTAYFTI